eukprot:1595632-Alexandrium_andersonii.AAC.1
MDASSPAGRRGRIGLAPRSLIGGSRRSRGFGAQSCNSRYGRLPRSPSVGQGHSAVLLGPQPLPHGI